MMKRTRLGVLLLLTASTLYAQSCMPTSGASTSDNLSNIKIGSMTASSDGLIHVSYGFDSTVDPNTQTLFANAVQQWNGIKGTTGVVFEQVAAGSAPNISMGLDFQNSFGCIAINARQGSIAFNNGWQQLETNSPTTATASIAQELGHFMD